MDPVTVCSYTYYTSYGVNAPKYWVISQIFKVDAEAAMCAVADAEESRLFQLWSELSYMERTYRTVKWFRQRLAR